MMDLTVQDTLTVTKVFVVEDSLIIRERIKRMLATIAGVQVVGEAFEADSAILSIPQFKPDVVILDIQLLTGTGMQVLNSIKKTKHPPVVIILTNYPEFRTRYLNAGADYFIDKSAEFYRLPMIIRVLAKE